MRLVLGSRFNPVLERLDLLLFQTAEVSVCWGHHEIWVGGDQALDQFTGLGVTGDDGWRRVVAQCNGLIAYIEPEISPAVFWVLAVAEKTIS